MVWALLEVKVNQPYLHFLSMSMDSNMTYAPSMLEPSASASVLIDLHWNSRS